MNVLAVSSLCSDCIEGQELRKVRGSGVIGFLSGIPGSGVWSSDEHKPWESFSKGSGAGFMARFQGCHHSETERGTVLKRNKTEHELHRVFSLQLRCRLECSCPTLEGLVQ